MSSKDATRVEAIATWSKDATGLEAIKALQIGAVADDEYGVLSVEAPKKRARER